ncbi:MAG: HesB/YadR/YfhF family protein, partial [Firmicutes bacterium]|nr:HesB/YadR/YfhF family protein [Bacillota bacterium]
TDAAARQIAALTNQTGAALRIELRPGGCCGTYYQFTLSPPHPGDVPAGASVYLQPEAAAILTGATLDYGARLKPPRFRVLRSPNTPEKCPCGRSFGAPFPGRPTLHCQAYRPIYWDQDP